MRGRHLDHANLRIPTDGIESARAFYGDALGFGIETARYEANEKPFFDVRLAPTAVLHLWPTDEFEVPSGTNVDHICVVVEESIAEIRTALETAGVQIDHQLDSPLGATGEAPSVYITDPFGYVIEVKARG